MGIPERLDPRLKLRHLLIAVAVADHGSVLRAAGALFVTQPVVSRAVAELEEILGVTLFVRQARGMTPTEAGQSYLRHARTVLGELRTAGQRVEDLREGYAGTVAVGTFVAASHLLVPHAILALGRSRPGLRVIVREGTVDELLQGLFGGELDVVAGRAPRARDHRLEFDELYREPMVLVTGLDHPAQDAAHPAGLPALLDYPWVLPLRETDLRTELDDVFHQAGTGQPADLVECSTVLTVRQLLRGGRHVGVLPLLVARHDPELAVLPTPLPTVSWGIGLTRLRGAPTAATAALIAALHEAAVPLREQLEQSIEQHYPGSAVPYSGS
ncbi:LysR substrate-binding domain-containing protein [Granulicoccus sp. GXG6511]|uniref:LysR substrate-binding domain-containing protein n=1 Tax=Granulicoccus sp. GXG6511 TaxID=3381351 RepID=UPI003D7D82F2